MPPKKLTTNQINYPWPDIAEFIIAWDNWKEYKLLEHKFRYKSAFSEQAALNRLVAISDGEVDKAIATINFAMSNGWKGLYPDKTTSTNNNSNNAKQNRRNSAIDEIARSLFDPPPERVQLGRGEDTGNNKNGHQ